MQHLLGSRLQLALGEVLRSGLSFPGNRVSRGLDVALSSFISVLVCILCHCLGARLDLQSPTCCSYDGISITK